MSRKQTNLLASALFVLMIVIICAGGSAGGAVPEKKTLKRFVDPILMDGALAEDLVGLPLDNLRLYACRDGVPEPILFQIDELTKENGDWILTGGPIRNDDLSNGKFDAWDKLVFMAADTGDRLSKEEWPGGYSQGCEIEVTDPLNNEKGWAYLLYFAADPPPRSTREPYVSYDYDTEKFKSKEWEADYIITDDGLHSTFYRTQLITEAAGGNGQNYVDRIKIRTRFRVFGIPISIDEEKLKCNVIGHQLGPIRLLRRVEQYVQIAGIPALRVVEDVNCYRYTATVPVEFEVPIGHPRWIGVTAVVRIGTDFNDSVRGSRFYSSTTRPEGYLVNGKMDDGEENYPSASDNWRLITGRWGTFMNRTVMNGEAAKNIAVTLGMIDDETRADPPESLPGSIGYVWQDWDFSDAAKGKYYVNAEFYFIPHYRPGDERQFLNYLDHPLHCRVGQREGVSRITYRPEKFEDRYRKHYSPEDIRKHLEKHPMKSADGTDPSR